VPQGYILAWLSEITRKQEKQEIPTPRLKAPDVEGGCPDRFCLKGDRESETLELFQEKIRGRVWSEIKIATAKLRAGV